MLWILALHIISMVAWFAGLFYLPRLFVYHADATDQISLERFKIMERRLYYAIMMPSAVLTTIFGFWLIALNPAYYMSQGWMHAKLGLIVALWVYHLYCARLVWVFKHGQNTHSALFYRWFNELPTVVLIAVVILVVVRPF